MLPSALLDYVNYLRRPSFATIARYLSISVFWRYARRLRRRPTILKRPRREWWSCLFVFRCSVRWLILAVSRAICTSGEPVSPSCIAYFAIISCLFIIVSPFLIYICLWLSIGSGECCPAAVPLYRFIGHHRIITLNPIFVKGLCLLLLLKLLFFIVVK